MTLAVIMQMRKRVGLLIGIIGVAIVAFLMMDAINSSSNLFGGNTQNVVGHVNGEELAYEAYSAKDRQVEKQFLYFQGNWQNPEFTGYTPEERANQRNFAWREFVINNLLDDVYQNLGLQVTDQELNNQFASNNPRTEVRNFYQQVIDPSGAYNPQNMTAVIPQIQAIAPGDQNYAIKDFFLQLKDLLRQEMLRDKFTQLFAQSIFVPEWKAALHFEHTNNTVDLKSVGLQYSTLENEKFQPTDKELKAYLEAHKAAYEGPALRDIEYVVFDIFPSPKDSASALQFVNEKWAQIEKTGRDSLYIRQYSETPYTNAYFTRDEVLTQMADSLFSVEEGTVIGPFLENGKYRIIQLTDRTMLPDSVQVRHVFAGFQQLDEAAAKARIDSVKMLYDQGVPFDSLALQFSTDQNSAAQGGLLGYLSPSDDINRPIFNALFRQPDADTPFVLRSPAGYHFMEVLERSEEKEMVQYHVLDRSIRPGSKTRDSIYAIASRFYTVYGTADSFDAGVKAFNLVKRFGDDLTGSEVTISGMGVPAQTILRWAFEAEKGDVQLFRNFESTDNKYIVAKLTGVQPANSPTIDNLREELTAKVITRKKAEHLKNQLATAAAGATTLDQIASNLSTDVKTATGISFSTQFIEGIGAEPVIAGVATGLAVEEISSPVDGEYGVYLVQTTAEQAATPPQDYSITRQQLAGTMQGRFGQNLVDRLRTSANVVDMRYKFY